MGFDSSPEPEPEFHMAMEIWGAAFPAHVYIFAVLFMILSLYNVNSVVGLALKAKHVKKKTIFMFANIMLWSFNLVTALQLFIDPYGSNMAMKLKGADFLAFGMKLPCLTCAFSFIYIALIETTKVKLYSRKLHNIKYFVAIVLIHFIVSLAVHLYLVMTNDHFKVVIICLAFFLLFSLAISFLFLFNYCKIKRLLGGNSAHVPTMKFRSSPNLKKDARLTLSTHVDDHDGGSYKSYSVQNNALARGIVNEGVQHDNVKEEISLNSGVGKADVVSNEIDATVIENGHVVHNDVNCTVTSSNDDPALGIVNHGLDIEDGVKCEITKDSDDTEKDVEEANNEKIEEVLANDDKNDGDDEEDNPDDTNVKCDDNAVADDTTSASNENDETQHGETQLEDKINDHKLHETNDVTDFLGRDQLKITVYEISDIELSDSEYGVPQSVTAENDPSHLRVPISSSNERLQQIDEVSQVSCDGYIIQTYSTTNSTPATEKPTPVITTNVIASLKRPSTEDAGTAIEPFGNVASKFALPNGGTAQRKQPIDMNLSRKKPAFVDKSLNKLLKLVVVVTLSSILYCSAIIYYIIIVLCDNEQLQRGAWPWFIYQTVARIAEFGMSGTMSYLVRRSLLSFSSCKKK